MSDVLQEVTELEITRDHVERRLDDWSRRIAVLYDLIESWLPAGWKAERVRSAQINEEPMRLLRVPARPLPILDIVHDGRRIASIEPRGLWIVGANGRLDFTSGDVRYLITDEAENFASPRWTIREFAAPVDPQPLDARKIRSLLL